MQRGKHKVRSHIHKPPRHQLLLGDDAFADLFQEDRDTEELREHSTSQKRVMAISLREYQRRNEALANAGRSGACSMREISEHFSIHCTAVSWVAPEKLVHLPVTSLQAPAITNDIGMEVPAPNACCDPFKLRFTHFRLDSPSIGFKFNFGGAMAIFLNQVKRPAYTCEK